MKSMGWMLMSVLVLEILAACNPGGGAAVEYASPGEAPTEESSRLRDDYAGALSIQAQLAAGTLLFEGTELAVDEVQAAELLPLWQAVQNLNNSDTAASVEIEAVLNQIQDAMAPAQLAAIAEKALTEEALTTMLEEGELAPGPGGFGGRFGATTDEGGQARPPGEGFPGGGFPGGGPGGFQGVDPEAIATRQAEFAGAGAGAIRERLLTGAVVRLLGTRAGAVAVDQPGRLFEVVFEVVAEATGLNVEEIQAQTAGGATLAEIVEASGGDVEAVQTALVDALGELPNMEGQDLEQLASWWLDLEP